MSAIPPSMLNSEFEAASRKIAIDMTAYRDRLVYEALKISAGDPVLDRRRQELFEMMGNWPYLSDDEIGTIQAECGVMGHVWPAQRTPSKADPLAQLEHPADPDAPCVVCNYKNK